MEKILGILLFLLFIGGASALRWWIEKQQREKKTEQREHRPLPHPPSVPSPDRRPVFYDRGGENPRLAATEAEPQPSPAPQAEPLIKPPGTTKPAATPVVATQQTPFLGNLLKGRNVARAIVLSEILGPPKAFRDF